MKLAFVALFWLYILLIANSWAAIWGFFFTRIDLFSFFYFAIYTHWFGIVKTDLDTFSVTNSPWYQIYYHPFFLQRRFPCHLLSTQRLFRILGELIMSLFHQCFPGAQTFNIGIITQLLTYQIINQNIIRRIKTITVFLMGEFNKYYTMYKLFECRWGGSFLACPIDWMSQVTGLSGPALNSVYCE